ncbi:JM7 [macacine gammaherpesvirus 11]|uniref:JM7 n=2 Tax=macacine gammaherpesvirus 11 TaxID=2560570 RepID=G9JMI5_9GAMA|nr:JM7 [Macaca fuscata rhadinovirus]AAS99984.1 JM7 [Macaca fuscata rhadinovirus]AEW87532.1 JM7 [Macaca fuscata rhadinovirus]AEW87702.1 JM7 [Macaca fuscata rhadinovirus]
MAPFSLILAYDMRESGTTSSTFVSSNARLLVLTYDTSSASSSSGTSFRTGVLLVWEILCHRYSAAVLVFGNSARWSEFRNFMYGPATT